MIKALEAMHFPLNTSFLMVLKSDVVFPPSSPSRPFVVSYLISFLIQGILLIIISLYLKKITDSLLGASLVAHL